MLLRDIADVTRLRGRRRPDLVTQGSTELVHALLANDLVDAMSIFTWREAVQERVMRQIRMLRAMRRELETVLRRLL